MDVVQTDVRGCRSSQAIKLLSADRRISAVVICYGRLVTDAERLRPLQASVLGIFAGKFIFRFHPGILLGACAGARTTTAALGMINEVAKSQVPSLGYTVTYAVGNTLLTIWGIVIVMLLS